MIGHLSQLQFFQNAIEQGTLSHAYLLVGPNHVGKTTLAQTVAAQLLDTTIERLDVHPDMRTISQAVNEKTGKLRKNISIEQVRDMRQFAAAGPVSADHSVLLITEAELLNKQAANALLKTLEEPHPKTTIFLTTTDAGLLPETIVSRSQVLYLSPVSDDLICEAVADHPSAEAIVRAAAGLPGRAMVFAGSADVWEFYQQTVREFQSLIGKPLFEKRNQIESLLDSKDDHIAGRKRLIETMHTWQQLLPQLSLSSTQTVAIYDILLEAEQMLRQNVHPRAVMDAVLLTIP